MERSKFVQELLDEHIFIKYENEVYLYRKDLFGQMNLSSTYNRYGRVVGHEDAGDNHMDNGYSELYNTWQKYTQTLPLDYNYEEERIKYLEQHKEEIDCIQCYAHNYWNGSNYNTLLLSSDNPNFTVEEQLTEEEAAEVAAIIEQAEDNDNYVNQGGAQQTMVGYYIVEKEIAWVGQPQDYSVINTESADFSGSQVAGNGLCEFDSHSGAIVGIFIYIL